MKVDPKGATEQLLYATVLIFTETGSGEKGSGTGFFFNYEMGKSFVPFLVTNKHVVNDTVAGQIGVHIANKEEWKPSPENFLINFPDFPNLWLKHPDPDVDICVAPVGEIFIWLKDQGKRVFYRA